MSTAPNVSDLGGITPDVTCLGCGCLCDDIQVVVGDGRIITARNACALGKAWFGDGRVPSRTLVDGRDAALEDALTAAAERLLRARSALVYLAPNTSCEGQRTASAIADLVGATLDSVTSATALHHVLAAQAHGLASATLGEIRHRADVLVFWAVDVDRRYPRFATRYAPEPAGIFVPEGRRSRTVIAVDVGDATSPIEADHRLSVAPADEIATLTALRGIVASPAAAARRKAAPTAPAWTTAAMLAPALSAARYVGLVYDAEPDDRAPRSAQRFEALAALAQQLNDVTRCAAIPLRAGGNRSGADMMLTAATGYPFAVDFSRGYPRYRPHESSAAAVLARGEADLALVIGDARLVPDTVAGGLARMAHIVIGPHASTSGSASIAIDTGVPGIHESGTALRTDDVPLPARPSVAGPPSAGAIIGWLADAIARQRTAGAA